MKRFTSLTITTLALLTACSSSTATPTTTSTTVVTTTTLAPTTTATPTTLEPMTTKPVSTTKPPATTQAPKTTNAPLKSDAEILADAKAVMESADTKFMTTSDMSYPLNAKLSLEKKYASVGMKVLPHATGQNFYNIKFSGVSHCFLADFDGERTTLVPSACW